MGKRRAARQAAVQFHFWRDMHGDGAPEKMDEFWEFCPAKPNVRAFAQPLIDGMVAHLPRSMSASAATRKTFDLRRISPVDRNVLRLAIFEMLHRGDIPPVVSINEAIELAKMFGGPDSGRFVNGIPRPREERFEPTAARGEHASCAGVARRLPTASKLYAPPRGAKLRRMESTANELVQLVYDRSEIAQTL
jgi:N utilization substance protein B